MKMPPIINSDLSAADMGIAIAPKKEIMLAKTH
jgi:hypothetical protein